MTTTKTKTARPLIYDRKRLIRIDDRTDRELVRRAHGMGISTSALIRMTLVAAMKQPTKP